MVHRGDRSAGALAATLCNVNKTARPIRRHHSITWREMPDFNANKLGFLLLPNPNMPTMSLSRAEITDLTDCILSLK